MVAKYFLINNFWEKHSRKFCYVFFRFLASGSGDTTVRFWDVNTETPQYTCKGANYDKLAQ